MASTKAIENPALKEVAGKVAAKLKAVVESLWRAPTIIDANQRTVELAA